MWAMEKVFDIGGASHDEVEGIRNLLEENQIRYYETPDSNYGRSTAAIWVYNKKDLARARQVINAIQSNIKIMNKMQPTNSNSELRKKKLFLPFMVMVIVILMYMLIFGLTRP
jgi:lipopolysaccharide export LptBFGC system permease protein LptF